MDDSAVVTHRTGESGGARALLKTSLVAGADAAQDRESAYERLTGRVAGRMGDSRTSRRRRPPDHQAPRAPWPRRRRRRILQQDDVIGDVLGSKTSPRSRQTVGEAAMKSSPALIGSPVGRRAVRGVLGSGILRGLAAELPPRQSSQLRVAPSGSRPRSETGANNYGGIAPAHPLEITHGVFVTV